MLLKINNTLYFDRRNELKILLFKKRKKSKDSEHHKIAI